LRYLLPPNKVSETIKLSEIRNIEIKLSEIHLQLSEGNITLNLENFHFKELRRIKEKFEEIKMKMDKQ
jgi:methyl coenzyme M reductase subunit D